MIARPAIIAAAARSRSTRPLAAGISSSALLRIVAPPHSPAALALARARLAARRAFASQQQPQQRPQKPETPIETAIREARDEAAANASKSTASSSTPSNPTPAADPSASASTEIEPAKAKKPPLLERIKKELVHYWDGTKLLGTEISISMRLLYKLLHGQKLSRRESRQLRRTTGDLLRLVPFVVIVLIPFLEFALPVLLRFFPNMLPSTFESKFQEEEKKKKLLKVRLEVARFLQETVAESALSGSTKAEAAHEFSEFFLNCRTSGQMAPIEDILRVARKFQDELTLTNLSRPQLVSMAKYMNINAFGTDAFLRFQIERRIQYLDQDDRMIAAEGVDSLTIPELQQVCLSRGIRTVGVSPARMRSKIQQWIDLHLVHKVPMTLLILSHAFRTTERLPSSSDEALKGSAEALQATLSSLPHQVVNEAQLKVSEADGTATYKQKLEIIKEQEEMIADELEQEAAAASKQESKRVKEQESSEAAKTTKPESAAAESVVAKSEPVAEKPAAATPEPAAAEPVAEKPEPIVPPASAPVEAVRDETITKPVEAAAAADKPESVKEAQKEVVPVELVSSKDEKKPTAADDESSSKVTPQELKKLGDALKAMTGNSALSDVREELDDLKEDREDLKEDLEELEQVTQKPASKAASRLTSRIDKMLSGIETELAKYDSEIGSKLNVVRPNDEGKISIEDLETVFRVIQTHPNDARIRKIVTSLDEDGDGMVALQEILSLAESAEQEGHGEVIDAKKQEEEKRSKEKQSSS